jgi:type I restriction enzyme S subunit
VIVPLRQLQEFCRITQGGRQGLSGNDFVAQGVPAYGAGGINGYLPTAEFEEPAVILSSIGARCGKCFYADGKWASLSNTQLIFPDPAIADARFLWFQLNDETRWHRSGTAQPFIKPADVKTHKVLLPSLSEQRRMAELLYRADALRNKRREALALLASLTQATFLDLFGDPARNPNGWPTASLDDLIASGPQNGIYKPSSDYGSGTPILRIDAFYDGAVTKLATLKRVHVTAGECDLYGLRTGDIIVNRVNSLEYLGKSALVPHLDEPTIFESNMMRFAVDCDRVEPRYVVQFLQSRFVKGQILAAAKNAVNQSSINQKDVKEFRINVPPLSLQREFVRQVASIQRSIVALRASLSELDALFVTLRHRAFREDVAVGCNSTPSGRRPPVLASAH